MDNPTEDKSKTYLIIGISNLTLFIIFLILLFVMSVVKIIGYLPAILTIVWIFLLLISIVGLVITSIGLKSKQKYVVFGFVCSLIILLFCIYSFIYTLSNAFH